MTAALLDLVNQAETTLWTGFAIFLRVAGIIGLVPAFGEQSVPVRVKLGLALAFSLAVLPAVTPILPAGPPTLQIAAVICGRELLTGLFFGLVLRLFVMALQIAGTIAAQSTSVSQIFGGSAGVDPMPAMGHVLFVSGLALVCLMDLHVRLVAFIILTYEIVHFGAILSGRNVAEAGIAEVSRCFSLGFMLAAPFVVASLLYNVTLGAINRAMPQLMVAFIGAPAITAGGLAMLALASPFLIGLWASSLFDFMNSPFGAQP